MDDTIFVAAEACGEARNEAELAWHEHPAFPGVFLKHLITGADTGGALSAHLVRVEPGAAIGEHTHETQFELHEVLEGGGECLARGRSMGYAPGVRAALPRAEAHAVRAGSGGLLLRATFAPALV